MFDTPRRGHEPSTNDRHRPNSDDSVPTLPSRHSSMEQPGHHSSVVSKESEPGSRVRTGHRIHPGIAPPTAQLDPTTALTPTPPARLHRHQRGDIHSPTSQKIPSNPATTDEQRPSVSTVDMKDTRPQPFTTETRRRHHETTTAIPYIRLVATLHKPAHHRTLPLTAP